MNEDILNSRRNLMRRRNHRLTPEERLDRFYALQRRAFTLLKRSEQGFDYYIRRNFRKRRIRTDHDAGSAE